MGEIVLTAKRILIVVIAVLTTLLTTLSLPAQAASAPGKPVAKISSGNARVVLSWVAPASNGSTITSYQAVARKYAAGKWQAWSYYNLSRTSRSKSVAYTNGTKVQAKVRAKNAKGFGSWSTIQSTVTGLPNAPASRSVTQGNKSLTVSWGAAVGNGSAITAYRVYYRSQVGGVWRAWAYATTSGSIRTKTFGSLTPGTNYQFYIKSANKWGYGPSTSTLSTVVLSAPDSPTNVTGTPSEGQVALSWSAPLNTGGSPITSYTATTVGLAEDLTKTCTSTNLTCTITAPNPGSFALTYTFTVTATNMIGTSPSSSPSSPLTLASPPSAPTGVTGTPDKNQVTLSWTAPLKTGGWPITSYSATAVEDETKTCDGFTYPGASLTCTIVGLNDGTPYTFTVTAKTNAGASLPSTPSQTVVPGHVLFPPRISQASPLSASATIAWSYSPSQVTAGNGHTCALWMSGGIKCWGANSSGQLGNGTTTESTTPVDVTGLTSGVKSVNPGGANTCALLTTSYVQCWGDNSFWQLRNGNINSSNTPVAFTFPQRVIALGVGDRHTCSLSDEQYVPILCWGDDSYGQLSGAASGSHITQVGIDFADQPTAISAAFLHTCVLLNTGGVKCWGDNGYGRLGRGTDNSKGYGDVTGLTSGVTAISAGGSHTCALLNTGGVKCWGMNTWGQLGNGTNAGSNVPVNVAGLTSGVTAISAGAYHTCALLNTGGVKCWGMNTWGQLGNGTNTDSNVPVNVADLTSGVTAISAGQIHTCALLTDGGIKCWGGNGSGELGDGTTAGRNVPVDVQDTTAATGVSYTVSAVQDPTKTCTVSAPAPSCAVDGLTPGQTYTFTVTATNAFGTSTPSAPSDPITIP
jgi:alpha-tubulin suppressor-like RCC1 family protein